MGVSLSKGQSVSLAKSDGSALRYVHMGLGWDAAKGMFGRPKAIDLDASCMIFDAQKQLIDQVWFNQLRSNDSAVIHTGDNRTGKGDGDDESITVNLEGVSPAAHSLVFVVNSFTGESFAKIENAYCRLVDMDTQVEIARYELTGSGPHTAQIMAKLVRAGSGWEMVAIGQIGSGSTFKDLLPAAVAGL